MDIYKKVNIFCLICGIGVVIFGLLILAGVVTAVPVYKTPVIFFLGGIIILWAVISMIRRRNR